VLVAASAFAILGLVEDVHGVPALARLLTQFVIAVLVVAAVSVPVGWMLMAMFFVVAYVNAFNFMDGVNGISGLNATMTGLVYAWLATDHGLTSLASASLVLAAASLGFLPWNMPRARVFLGDVGSYALGGIVAALALGLLVGGVDWVLVFAPLSLYLADTGTTLGRRVMAGEQILEPHRDHTYQRLTDRGLSHSAVAFATSTMAVLATIVAIVLDRATSSSIAALAGVGAIVGVYLWLPYSPGLRGGGHLAPKSVEPS
jgi:UDP-N-acetylmuramyl pentapeptide phosphotransferase/UDP-N-acetylglucosamine-1-phosphate transferase